MKKIILIALVGLFTLMANQSFAQSKKNPVKNSITQTKKKSSKNNTSTLKLRKNSKKQKVDKVQMRKSTKIRRKKEPKKN